MIDQARARHRGMAIEFRVGDAASLDLPDASLDAVLMNFGMMHMARPEAVAHMAGRVLRDRGRFCYTVWAPTEQSVASRIVADVMGLAEVPVQMPAGEPFYRFCDIDENRRLLGAAGFDADSIVMEDVPLLWRFSEAGELFELFAAATTRSALVLAAQSEATRRKIEDAFARAVSAWSTADGDFAIPHAAVAVTARRAGRL
jgi:SAM-dependent methyltransferase